MDWHKLQHTLFEMDPTDPREDLAKLQAQAGGQPQESVKVDRDYVQESVEIPEGSLEMDRDYSVADFAALAGVTVTEAQKKGSAGQAKGKDPMPKAEPGRTKHPLKDKLVGEDDDRIAALEARVAQLEEMLEAQKKPSLKPRDPNAQTLNDLRSSGAMGAHKDKKKLAKQGYSKHKGKQYESIKDELWAKLNKFNK